MRCCGHKLLTLSLGLLMLLAHSSAEAHSDDNEKKPPSRSGDKRFTSTKAQQQQPSKTFSDSKTDSKTPSKTSFQDSAKQHQQQQGKEAVSFHQTNDRDTRNPFRHVDKVVSQFSAQQQSTKEEKPKGSSDRESYMNKQTEKPAKSGSTTSITLSKVTNVENTGKSGGIVTFVKPPKATNADNIGLTGASLPSFKPPKVPNVENTGKSGGIVTFVKPPKVTNADNIGVTGASLPSFKPPKVANAENPGQSSGIVSLSRPPKVTNTENPGQSSGIVSLSRPPKVNNTEITEQEDDTETTEKNKVKKLKPWKTSGTESETQARSELSAPGGNAEPSPSIFFSDYNALLPFTLPSTTTQAPNTTTGGSTISG